MAEITNWQDHIPNSDDTFSLGSILKRFKDIFLSGRITYRNAFTFTVPANVTSVAVQFPVPFPSEVIPVVVCAPGYQTSFWITDITNSQFVFNVGSPSAYYTTSGKVNCIAMRTQ